MNAKVDVTKWDSRVVGQLRHPGVMQATQVSRAVGAKYYSLCFEKKQGGKDVHIVVIADRENDSAATQLNVKGNAIFVNSDLDVFIKSSFDPRSMWANTLNATSQTERHNESSISTKSATLKQYTLSFESSYVPSEDLSVQTPELSSIWLRGRYLQHFMDLFVGPVIGKKIQITHKRLEEIIS
ncbi:hypothetical protein VTL71DRAFT_6322 [Oculimacula yallundae]|uniref:Uncharacterized protein n=1 Tax=Oculimacula yallundae TaxID=86028 RepID=A0ABR4BY58_9HELO